MLLPLRQWKKRELFHVYLFILLKFNFGFSFQSEWLVQCNPQFKSKCKYWSGKWNHLEAFYNTPAHIIEVSTCSYEPEHLTICLEETGEAEVGLSSDAEVWGWGGEGLYGNRWCKSWSISKGPHQESQRLGCLSSRAERVPLFHMWFCLGPQWSAGCLPHSRGVFTNPTHIAVTQAEISDQLSGQFLVLLGWHTNLNSTIIYDSFWNILCMPHWNIPLLPPMTDGNPGRDDSWISRWHDVDLKDSRTKTTDPNHNGQIS